MLRRMFLMTVLCALTFALGSGFAPVARAQGPFWNLLGVGQGETANTLEVGTFLAGGGGPASFTSQRGLFDALLGKGPSVPTSELASYFKDARIGPASIVSSREVRPGTVIARDAFGVPHVSARSRVDAMFAVGWAQAADRLFMMDVLRRTAQGRLTELIGPSQIALDARALDDQDYSQAELSAQISRVAGSGPTGAAAAGDLAAYVDGVNAYIAAARNDLSLMPGEYPLLGKALEDWRATDTVSIVALLTYFAPTGGVEHLAGEVMAALRARLGARAGRRVFDDFRAAADPEGPSTDERAAPGQRLGTPRAAAVALPDAGSTTPLQRVSPPPPAGPASLPGPSAPPAPVGWLQRLRARGFALHAGGHSNALLVAGRRSTTGRPLFVAGPQVDFFAPALFWEVGIQAPGIAVRGYGVPGLGPFVVIGHDGRAIFSATTSQSDLSDVFAQRVCATADGLPSAVLYRGKCETLERTTRTVSWSPGPADLASDPAVQPSTHTITVLRSRYGPVIATGTVGAKPVAYSRRRASYGRELDGAIAFAALNTGQVRTAKEFVATLGATPGAYNWFYANGRDIAHVSAGYVPLRARGVDPDLPVRGDGAFDWTGGRLPVRRLPQQINPRRGYLTSWNNRPAPGWRPADSEWQYGSTHRVQRLNTRMQAALRNGRKLDLGGLVGVMGDAGTVDVRGQEVLPLLLDVLGSRSANADVTALREWLAAGAHRADRDRDGTYEHSRAVALMDAWWEPLARAIYEPVIGAAAIDAIARINSIDGLPKDTADTWFHGWHAYLHKDLRQVLGRRVRGRTSRTYCGRGSMRACRATLLETLAAASARVPAGVRIAPTCPVTTPATCDQLDFIAAGAIEVDPIPWQDRGSAQQAAALP